MIHLWTALFAAVLLWLGSLSYGVPAMLFYLALIGVVALVHEGVRRFW
jgi:hypothetical protein